MTQKTFKLLIVDDDPENLKLLSKIFNKENYYIQLANNGEEALNIIDKKQFDLILLDVNMPGMDGFEICKKIRLQSYLNTVPIIFLTAQSDRDSIINGFEIGAQDYVTKPFESRELRARVKTHLSLKNNIEQLANVNKLLEEKVIERTSQLSKALEKAEESDHLKSAFLANISHEIRTPMNGILGFIDLLKRPGLSTEKQSFYIDVISESGKRMLNIMNDIVDLSKIESGLAEIHIQATHVNNILKYLYEFFNPKALKKKINLSYSCGINDLNCTIDTDENKLTETLTNLIENALKFTNSGSIEFGYNLNANIVPIELEFYVYDTGIGIPSNKLSLIFDRFMQADISLTRNYDGAGLGLSIAKSYVEMLNGKIWVESEVGKGSKFYFSIPLKHSGNFQTEINKIIHLNKIIKPFNILIVEDDKYSTQYLKEMFEEEKVNLFFANNGQKAIDIIKEIPEIDLVLMDIKMPVMDGYEATRLIKKIKPNLPIIAQTAHAMSDDAEKSKLIGMDGYITKPFNENQLFDLINKYLVDN